MSRDIQFISFSKINVWNKLFVLWFSGSWLIFLMSKSCIKPDYINTTGNLPCQACGALSMTRIGGLGKRSWWLLHTTTFFYIIYYFYVPGVRLFKIASSFSTSNTGSGGEFWRGVFSAGGAEVNWVDGDIRRTTIVYWVLDAS